MGAGARIIGAVAAEVPRHERADLGFSEEEATHTRKSSTESARCFPQTRPERRVRHQSHRLLDQVRGLLRVAPHQDLFFVRRFGTAADGSVVGPARDVPEGDRVQRGDGPRPEERVAVHLREDVPWAAARGVGAAGAEKELRRGVVGQVRRAAVRPVRRRRLRWGGFRLVGAAISFGFCVVYRSFPVAVAAARQSA